MKSMELAIEMETISNEMIKPSKATPPHLRSYKLSFLDHLLPYNEHTPWVFYNVAVAPPRNKDIDTATRLKEALSDAISLYYPIAGRISLKGSTIDCNDTGVPLSIVRANCTLFDFLAAPNRLDLLPLFLPQVETFIDINVSEGKGLVMLASRICVFNCSGFAVGNKFINKAFDGISWAQFFETWGAISRGSPVCELETPDFTSITRIFPPVANDNVSVSPQVIPQRKDQSGDCVVKVFEFTPANISRLQAMARSDSVPNPTRVESVTCFLWKHLMAAAAGATHSPTSNTAGQQSSSYVSTIIHPVNIRPYVRPILPSTISGKFTTHASAYWEIKEGDAPDVCDLVKVLRQSLSKAKDGEWWKKFQGEGRIEAAYQYKKTFSALLPNAYFFTSVAGFDRVNFGSGHPAWLGFTGGRPSSYSRNYIPLVQTSGRRIEAWLILDDPQMAVLESNKDFLAIARPSLPAFFSPHASL